MIRGDWIDPERGSVPLGAYAEKWIRERPSLRPRTVELYRWLLGKHVTPTLGPVKLADITTALVREWRSNLLATGVSQSVAAKSYRLLRAILNTAVEEDGLIGRNPCRVRGADRENAAERPVLTVRQVFQLADGMRYPQHRAMVLVAAFATLRWGEVTALRRCDVAPDGSWIRVSVAHIEVTGRGIVVGPPKSRAGVRTVVIPDAIRPDVVSHLATYVDVVLTHSSSPARRVERSGERTSITSRGGWKRSAGSACPACTSTTCGTPATTSRRRPARAPRT